MKSLLEEKEKALKDLNQQKDMIFGSQVSKIGGLRKGLIGFFVDLSFDVIAGYIKYK